MPEEVGVLKTCGEHALMPASNGPFRIAGHVKYRNEARHQSAVVRSVSRRTLGLRLSRLKRKVLLMVPHHRDKNFPRQPQKARLEAAEDGLRPFGGGHDPVLEG